MQILVVVDMQNDFIDGVLGTTEAVTIVPQVKEKIKSFQGKIFYTRDTHGMDYMDTLEGKELPVPHCIQNTHGWMLHPSLIEHSTVNIIDKPSFGSVELGRILQKISQDEEPINSVTLIGLCTDICVIANAFLIKSFLSETEIIVDASCCAGVTVESHQRALEAMKMCQIHIVND